MKDLSCQVCGHSPLPFRHRRFCSAKCRNIATYRRHKTRHKIWQREWRYKKMMKDGRPRLKCGICGRWYIQVGTHVYWIHGLSAREYREYMELPVKHGITPKWYRQLKGDLTKENGTYQNLLKFGKNTRYIPGDPRAKIMVGWKGKLGYGRRKLPPSELYETRKNIISLGI